MPDVWTVRLQGGTFDSERGFFSFSPELSPRRRLFAYEGIAHRWPVPIALRYTRHNVTGNFTGGSASGAAPGSNTTWARTISTRRARFRWTKWPPAGWTASGTSTRAMAGACAAGTLQRLLPPGGCHTAARFKVDGFVTRSLFDLYSNFTFFLHDPVHGDAFQQHDSRLIEGANAQYTRRTRSAARRRCSPPAPISTTTRSTSGCTRAKGACRWAWIDARSRRRHQRRGIRQESLTLLGGRMVLGGGCAWTNSASTVATWLCRDGRVPRWRSPRPTQLPPVGWAAGDALRQLWPRHLHRRRARRGATSRAARGLHHGFLPGGQRAALRTDLHQRRRLLDRPLQRAGLHSRRWQFEFKGPSRAYG
jgi:hypothetical protein